MCSLTASVEIDVRRLGGVNLLLAGAGDETFWSSPPVIVPPSRMLAVLSPRLAVAISGTPSPRKSAVVTLRSKTYGVGPLWLERAIALSEKDAGGVVIVVNHRRVRHAVAVEIRNRDVMSAHPGWIRFVAAETRRHRFPAAHSPSRQRCWSRPDRENHCRCSPQLQPKKESSRSETSAAAETCSHRFPTAH